ncbi:MAG TPA: hypothetical protein VEC17_02025 [Candidatus Binatia bacterium]|nr:hypothetical protein [Candidatus Binatia bacterium]
MNRLAKLKPVARFLVFLLLAQLVPVDVWAQQGVVATTVPAAGNTDPTLNPTPLPQLNFFTWTNYGADPLVPPELLPTECRDPNNVDAMWTCIQKIFLEEPGYEKASAMVWNAASVVYFRNNSPVPAWFKQELQEKIRIGKMRLETIPKGGNFYTGMAWSAKQADGTLVSRFTGPPVVAFDEPLQVFNVDPIVMREGPYYGHVISVTIPTKCINLTGLEGVLVPGNYPTVPPPKRVRVVVNKRHVDERGRQVDTPSRQEIQLRVEATPDTGGDPVKVELLDNKRAEFEAPVGTRYVLREFFESDRWRALNDKIELTVIDGKNEVTFENMRIPEPPAESQLEPGPLPPIERIIERERVVCDKCGGAGKKWLIGAVLAGAIVGGLLAANAARDNKTVIQDGRKGGSSSNGGAVASTAFSFGF